MKLSVLLCALALGAGASGCATITRGTSQDFRVESTPSGASVTTSNGFACAATPCTFRMQRKHGFTVDATLPGYLPVHAVVTSNLSGNGAAGMAGNVLIGGLIGVGVDATSGATQDLTPNPLTLTLEPIPPEPAVADAPASAGAATEPTVAPPADAVAGPGAAPPADAAPTTPAQ